MGLLSGVDIWRLIFNEANATQNRKEKTMTTEFATIEIASGVTAQGPVISRGDDGTVTIKAGKATVTGQPISSVIASVCAPGATKDEIDWTHVGDGFNAMARDEDGETWVYRRVPTKGAQRWSPTQRGLCRAKSFASYKRGTCDWGDSLVIRPGYEE